MEFPTTHWSQLAAATLHGDQGASGALAEFYRRYREPVIAFIRRRGGDPSRAEDLAHDFFLHLIEKSTLARADAAKGRFRSFLLGTLVRFLRDAREREQAAKRGGGLPVVSLDAEADSPLGPAVEPVAAAEFDREWAVQVLALACERLDAEFREKDRAADFAVLRAFLPGGVAPPPYEEGAARLGLTLGAFKTEVHRLRQRFRGCLREELARTVASPEEIDGEMAYLGRVLQGAAGGRTT
ncbi:MAG: sigma-70 family RNA polymerase sigma factor [Verrucomicrobia bacterium]|nr:sigma-70 family RNA polymerase sigma factor [Verrucomicrobiota bacterium]